MSDEKNRFPLRWGVASLVLVALAWVTLTIVAGDGPRDPAPPSAAQLFSDPVERTRHNLGQLQQFMERHTTRYGFPADLDVLFDSTLTHAPEGDLRVDPWGSRIRYERGDTSYSLRSAGPDGRDHTNDDIVRLVQLGTQR